MIALRFSLIAVMSLLLVGAGCSVSPSGASVDLGGLGDNSGLVQTDKNNSNENGMDEQKTWSFPGALSEEKISNKKVRIATAQGDIVIELFDKTAPLTVSNFVYLVEGGYYDGIAFHRREEGFVLQGGDPQTKTLPITDRMIGTGGPGYRFADELDDEYDYDRGIVAMANSGPNTNGSQFFIMLSDYPLPKSYSIFGRVIEGMEVVDALQRGAVMEKVTVE